ACPPAGDLRAPREALLAAADVVAALVPDGADPALPEGAVRVPGRLGGAISMTGERVSLAGLAGMRVGLALAIARPERVITSLAPAGVTPVVTVCRADPGAIALPAGLRVDAWLTTARCATKLPASWGGAPVLALEHEIDAAALARATGSGG